jgi:hypothetical protein
MLLGVSEHVKPEGETDDSKTTVPVNPLIGVTVMVEVPALPALTVTLVGLAVTEKSGTATLKLTVAECDSVPLVPVTVTVNVPLVVAVHDRVEIPDPVTLVGARVQVIPVAGLVIAVRLATAANPLTAVMVIVDVPTCFTLTATFVGLAEIVKS